MSFKLISALLRQNWAIDKAYADDQMPYVLNLIAGKAPVWSFDDEGESLEEKKAKAESANKVIASVNTIDMYWYNYTKRYLEGGVPADSIAIIDVDGPMMKNSYCGSAGMIQMAEWVRVANNDENIIAIMFVIDSPGGMVDGSSTLGDAISASTKPVWAFIEDGMCCSAAYMLAANANKIVSSHTKNVIGSIGVYTSIYDYSGYYEQLGIKKTDVYAPESSEKNNISREAAKDNFVPLQQDLSVYAQNFISLVESKRAINKSKSDPFKGATFFASEAIEIGLIDSISSKESTLEELHNLATNNKSKNMFGNKFKALGEAKGKESLEASEIAALNAELTEAGITAIQIVAIDAEKVDKSELTAANITIGNNETKITALEKERDEWKAKAVKLGFKPAAETDGPIPGADALPEKKKAEVHPWDVAQEEAKAKRAAREKMFGK